MSDKTFTLSQFHQAELIEALREHGVDVVSETTIRRFERHAARYHRRVLAGGYCPAISLAAQAMKIVQWTNETCEALGSGLHKKNRRRMTRELLARQDEAYSGERAMEDYEEWVNDVCSASCSIYEKAWDEVEKAEDKENIELKSLCRNIALEWRRATKRSLPESPKCDISLRRWSNLRRLQQHPLWIIFDALEIELDKLSTYELGRYATLSDD